MILNDLILSLVPSLILVLKSYENLHKVTSVFTFFVRHNNTCFAAKKIAIELLIAEVVHELKRPHKCQSLLIFALFSAPISLFPTTISLYTRLERLRARLMIVAKMPCQHLEPNIFPKQPRHFPSVPVPQMDIQSVPLLSALPISI